MMETIELSRFGVIVSHQNIEEPDEVKVSRPVLKTSGRGDSSTEFNYAPIAYPFLTLAVERILKGIADHFSELINEENNNFCLPFAHRFFAHRQS